jgi:hypothetical protein
MLTQRKKILPFSLIFLLLCTVSAFGAEYAGPTLNSKEAGWPDFGLVIRAEANVTLVSVKYPNQGLADVIELRRHSDSALLASYPVPAGDADATININYPLTSQEVYTLVATTPNNKYYGSLGELKFPLGDSDITVLYSYGVHSGTVVPFYNLWFSFNDIVTGPGEMKAVIDIKPGSNVNTINLKSKGAVPVAILTTDDFNALDVVPQTVTFAGAQPVKWATEDVNGDGRIDIILHFKTADLQFNAGNMKISSTGENAAVVSGNMLGGTPFSGADTVNIIDGE